MVGRGNVVLAINRYIKTNYTRANIDDTSSLVKRRIIADAI